MAERCNPDEAVKFPGTQNPLLSKVQEPDSDGFQSDKQLQKSEDSSQNEASSLVLAHETQQKNKEPAENVATQDSQQKSVENESCRQECREFAEDEALEQKIDANIMVKQKDESSFAPEEYSRQTNQPKADTIPQKCDVVAEDKLLELDRNAKVQQAAETPENALLIPDQKSIKVTQEEDNDAIHQECSGSIENKALIPKSEINLTVQQKDLYVSIKDLTQIAEQEANVAEQQECGRTTENSRLLYEIESGTESEVPNLMPSPNCAVKQERHRTTENDRLLHEIESGPKSEEPNLEPLQTGLLEQRANSVKQKECGRITETDRYLQETDSGQESEEPNLVPSQTGELEEVVSLQLPSRICHHRTHVMQRPRLPPVTEEPDLPLEPFVEEILVRRNRRPLGVRLPTGLPTGMRDYISRVCEIRIPPERRAYYEELQTRCVKLLCSLIIGALIVVALYFLIDFLESKYGGNGD